MPKKFGNQASKSRYTEGLFLKMERGTLARIDEVLERFEARSNMVREAIEHEIKRRAESTRRVRNQ
jgi:hypothetical protein